MTSYRFPKSARLVRSSEFRHAKQDGETHHGKYLLLNMIRGASPGGARVGLITSRRIGIAVQRNRVRRRLREIIRHIRPELPSGTWLVLVAKPRSASAPYSELLNDCQRLLVRSGLLKK